jgi:N-acetyl-anhydromuramoyl-L-alanine amidase
VRIDGKHWLTRVRRRPTPNCDDRAPREPIELVVIHCIALPPGRFGGGFVEALFCNALDIGAHPSFADLRGLRVSAHLFIDRRGRITQFVPFDRRAWHAGVSSWRGRPGWNRGSIGIELEGSDDRPFTRAQYRRLAQVLRLLLEHYPALAPDAIVGHSEIAPGRKTDPGPQFDWRAVLLGLARP